MSQFSAPKVPNTISDQDYRSLMHRANVSIRNRATHDPSVHAQEKRHRAAEALQRRKAKQS